MFTMCYSYFDFPRSATRCSLQFVLLHQVHNQASFFLLQVSRKSFFSAQYSLLEFHFSVCATASSPLVHFSLHIFFYSLLSRSPVPKPATSLIGGFAFCVLFGSAHKDSFLCPDSHAGYFFGFHRSAAGQRLLAPFPAWCLDSCLQFWLPGFFLSLAWISSASRAQYSHSFFR
jgi:hypothetical protein